ncbi:hypothetical protein [Micromonospora sp. KC723]|uniref:hypothetical protein n=1 Tax=Micromonospora sp. KC723 TaxID=2530381 RepID=UPI001044EB47|nr:hypothetical protein [Micromonospora sp. KC723]TDB72485.1 hypothetical protein E1165_20175 [Micromonospora sp. KC723]
MMTASGPAPVAPLPGPPRHPTDLRHPLDPDPVRATKSRAVFALGLIGALTGLFVGGVVPATVALQLARQARREAYASGGYLTGAAWLRRGERLAWVGLVLVAVAVVTLVVIGVVRYAEAPFGRDFSSNVD